MMQSTGITIKDPMECTVIGRLNRFTVQVEVDSDVGLAWINNTGRLEEFLVNGKRGFCTKNRPGMKTGYRLFAIREGEFGAIIDTRFQTQAFENIINMNLLPWISENIKSKREVRLSDSVIDYLLDDGTKKTYLEAKSAVLRDGNYAMYPDCPTERGRRHVRELITHRRSGGEAAIMFVAALPDINAFKPYREGDAALCDLLLEARAVGVDIRAIALFYDPKDSTIYLYNDDLPVELNGQL